MTTKNGINKPYVGRYFREWQHGPAWKCISPKRKTTKNARNHGNL